MSLRLTLLFVFSFLGNFIFANDSTGVAFTTNVLRTGDREVVVTIKAKLEKGLWFFSIKKIGDDALVSKVEFDKNLNPQDPIEELGNAIEEQDPNIEAKVRYFKDSVSWVAKLKLTADAPTNGKATINYFVKKGEEYLPFDEVVRFAIPTTASTAPATNANIAASDTAAKISTASPAPVNDVEKKSLWWIFFTAFAGGLLALLTPCVYSMIPVTVSFFTKRSKDPVEGKKNAILYALSIVAIFTIFGFLITLIFGPAALNNLSTNWIANLIFFLVFLVFGISFLGAFDINLPSSWSNKVDSKAGMGSGMGIFFMALTLVLVSFSCTGPIIGNLLVLAAKGNFYGPLVGMFGFSLALALPFALFAFFPSKLSVLGKAGGWLNAVKVSLGFLELALALKFLSNADLAKGWRLLDRETYLSLWIVIFLLLGIYLLGKLKFHHDDELPKNDFSQPYLSVTRLFFAMASLSFAIYLVPGLWGAPLKAASAFLPPMGTQDFILGGSTSSSQQGNTIQFPGGKTPLYYDKMHIYEPEVMKKFGLHSYFDFNEAKATAIAQNKPLMLDFTGINCVNCRKMEAQVWSNPEVMKRLKENFVIASLYVDVQNVEIPAKDQYFSKELDKDIVTLGDYNAAIQVRDFGANTQPYYFFLDKNGNRLRPTGYGYDPDVDKFIALLDEVKDKFHQQ